MSKSASDRLEGDAQQRKDDSDSESCPNGEQWCPGRSGDQLPCFDCFERDARQGREVR
jgi:hypothetical protein